MESMEALAIGLLVLALIFFIAEAHAPTTVLGLLGVGCLVGAAFAYRDAGHDIPVVWIIVGGLILAGFIVFASRKAFEAQRDEPVRTGWEQLVGSVAEVREPFNPEGQVYVDGALWKARLADGQTQVGLGNRVRIESVDGLTLVVAPTEDPATKKEE
jgi:membrane-bound serine protease (ClpP class)